MKRRSGSGLDGPEPPIPPCSPNRLTGPPCSLDLGELLVAALLAAGDSSETRPQIGSKSESAPLLLHIAGHPRRVGSS